MDLLNQLTSDTKLISELVKKLVEWKDPMNIGNNIENQGIRGRIIINPFDANIKQIEEWKNMLDIFRTSIEKMYEKFQVVYNPKITKSLSANMLGEIELEELTRNFSIDLNKLWGISPEYDNTNYAPFIDMIEQKIIELTGLVDNISLVNINITESISKLNNFTGDTITKPMNFIINDPTPTQSKLIKDIQDANIKIQRIKELNDLLRLPESETYVKLWSENQTIKSIQELIESDKKELAILYMGSNPARDASKYREYLNEITRYLSAKAKSSQKIRDYQNKIMGNTNKLERAQMIANLLSFIINKELKIQKFDIVITQGEFTKLEQVDRQIIKQDDILLLYAKALYSVEKANVLSSSINELNEKLKMINSPDYVKITDKLEYFLADKSINRQSNIMKIARELSDEKSMQISTRDTSNRRMGNSLRIGTKLDIDVTDDTYYTKLGQLVGSPILELEINTLELAKFHKQQVQVQLGGNKLSSEQIIKLVNEDIINYSQMTKKLYELLKIVDKLKFAYTKYEELANEFYKKAKSIVLYLSFEYLVIQEYKTSNVFSNFIDPPTLAIWEKKLQIIKAGKDVEYKKIFDSYGILSDRISALVDIIKSDNHNQDIYEYIDVYGSNKETIILILLAQYFFNVILG